MATVLYYPAKFGKPGYYASEWPMGKMPATLSEAVNAAKQYAFGVSSSDDGLPIYSPAGSSAVSVTSRLPPIDINQGAGTYTPEPWMTRNMGVIIMAGAVLFFVLAANMNPNRDDY
jgi:hypothetical protein